MLQLSFLIKFYIALFATMDKYHLKIITTMHCQLLKIHIICMTSNLYLMQAKILTGYQHKILHLQPKIISTRMW